MKILKSIEINEVADGKCIVQGVYVIRGETQYGEEDQEPTRATLSGKVHHAEAVRIA